MLGAIVAAEVVSALFTVRPMCKGTNFEGTLLIKICLAGQAERQHHTVGDDIGRTRRYHRNAPHHTAGVHHLHAGSREARRQLHRSRRRGAVAVYRRAKWCVQTCGGK